MEEDAKTTRPLFGILMALSLAHGLNDMMQSVITAVYPLLKTNLALSFAEIGAVTFTYQISASIFQPICGYLFDKKPNSWFLKIRWMRLWRSMMRTAPSNPSPVC